VIRRPAPWPRGRAGAAIALLLALAVLAGCTRPPAAPADSGPGPGSLVTDFAADWSAGRISDAAALTSQPAAASQLMTTVAADLKATGVQVVPGTTTRTDTTTATVSADVTWTLPVAGTWKYTTTWTWKRSGSTWRLQFGPTVIHPELGAQQTLVVRTTATSPGTIVDRHDAQLIGPVQVFSVVVLLNKVSSVAATATKIAAAVSRFDATITAATLTAGITAAVKAGDGAYTVINLRETEYDQVHVALADIPGVAIQSSVRDLPPVKDLAKVVLTQVVPVAQKLTAGTPGWRIATIDVAGDELATLAQKPPVPGPKVTLTLDTAMQEDAEKVLAAIPEPAVLVAIQPSTGEILTVAQNAPANAQGPIALVGQYPPGSTFKIVTGTAAIDAHLITPTTEVHCPGEWTIDGKTIHNEGFDLGTVTATTAFAHSCNTSFAMLSSKLPDNALPLAAKQYGVGLDFDIKGIITLTGKVPAADSLLRRAQNGFGQGNVLVTPFSEALMAATAANGSMPTPTLIRGTTTTVTPAPAARSAAAASAISTFMRAVVTDGTAKQLQGDGTVYAKTGTAEFTNDKGEIHAHAWTVGYRGDLAFAAMIVGGEDSKRTNAIIAAFLQGLPAGDTYQK
jgi:cell division protein FtsI/penicillin-binding protein 2